MKPQSGSARPLSHSRVLPDDKAGSQCSTRTHTLLCVPNTHTHTHKHTERYRLPSPHHRPGNRVERNRLTFIPNSSITLDFSTNQDCTEAPLIALRLRKCFCTPRLIYTLSCELLQASNLSLSLSLSLSFLPFALQIKPTHNVVPPTPLRKKHSPPSAVI